MYSDIIFLLKKYIFQKKYNDFDYYEIERMKKMLAHLTTQLFVVCSLLGVFVPEFPKFIASLLEAVFFFLFSLEIYVTIKYRHKKL